MLISVRVKVAMKLLGYLWYMLLIGNQAKSRKKSVLLFWLLNMAKRCEHVHGLELKKKLNFFKFCIAHIYQLSEK